VLNDRIRKEVLDLETNHRIGLGIDAQEEVITVAALKRDAGSWTSVSVEIDKERVRRPIVGEPYMVRGQRRRLRPRRFECLGDRVSFGHGHCCTSPRAILPVGYAVMTSPMTAESIA
jgi:hypothetical protein